jgi:hypothetical protein
MNLTKAGVSNAPRAIVKFKMMTIKVTGKTENNTSLSLSSNTCNDFSSS